MNAFKQVGVSYPRHEGLQKAMGTAKYTDDLTPQNLAYGMILRSPYAHARVKSIDTSEAEKMEGVLCILTPKDVTQRLYNCSGNPPSGLIVPDEVILTDHPRCLGDRVCAIAARTKAQCEAAIRKIKVEYEVLPSTMSIEAALKEGAPPVREDFAKDNIMKKLVFEQGDVEKGFAQADQIFEQTFHTQPIAHVCMEPTGCVCQYGADDKITIWSPSQTPYQERRILAELFDRKESDIRIIKQTMGGGFGARQQVHNQHVGVLLSQRAKCPVKLMNTREEDMVASVTRHETVCTIKMGVKKDGTITGVHIKNYLNAGAYITHSPTVSAAAGRKFQYVTENYLYEGISIYTNSPTAGAMRGYGNIQVVSGREVLMTRIAKELGLDPIEFRMKNHIKDGGRFPAASYDIHSCGIEDCVRQAEELKAQIDAKDPLRNDDKTAEAWGVAFCCHSSGPSNMDGMSSAIVIANDDGSVTLSIGSADIGQGSETIMGQIAAEELGTTYAQVTVSAADTGVNPYDTGTFASGQTYVCGNAVTRACQDLRRKLAAALENYESLPEGSVRYEDGVYVLPKAEGEQRLPFEQAVRHVAFGMKGLVLIGSASYKAVASPPPFAVCYAKASYNKETGAVRVKECIEIADVGTAINPESVKGQIEGGIAQGVGYAMCEDIEYDKRADKASSTDMLSYKVPLTLDMPNVYSGIARNVYEPSGPLGAKSIGELAQVPVAPAIVNAVCEATGLAIDSMPISRYLLPTGAAKGGERE